MTGEFLAEYMSVPSTQPCSALQAVHHKDMHTRARKPTGKLACITLHKFLISYLLFGYERIIPGDFIKNNSWMEIPPGEYMIKYVRFRGHQETTLNQCKKKHKF